jgi:hypothetical protein
VFEPIRVAVIVGVVLLGWLASGCVSETRSSAGPFVTDIRVEGTWLAVEWCQMGAVTQTGMLPIPYIGGAGKNARITRSGCRALRKALPGAVESTRRTTGGMP